MNNLWRDCPSGRLRTDNFIRKLSTIGVEVIVNDFWEVPSGAVSIIEAISAIESQSSILIAIANITENNNTIDSLDAEVIPGISELTEQINAIDICDLTIITISLIAENVSATDIENSLQTLVASISETLSAIDSLYSNRITIAAVADILMIEESLSLVAIAASNIIEEISVNELNTTTLVGISLILEDLTIIHNQSAIVAQFFEIVENTNAMDFIVASLFISCSISEKTSVGIVGYPRSRIVNQ